MKKQVSFVIIILTAALQASKSDTAPKILDAVTTVKPVRQIILDYLGFYQVNQEPDSKKFTHKIEFDSVGTFLNCLEITQEKPSRMPDLLRRLLPKKSLQVDPSWIKRLEKFQLAQMVLLTQYSWSCNTESANKTCPAPLILSLSKDQAGPNQCQGIDKSQTIITHMHPFRIKPKSVNEWLFFSISPNGKFFACQDRQKQFAVCDLHNGIRVIRSYLGQIECAAASSDGRYAYHENSAYPEKKSGTALEQLSWDDEEIEFELNQETPAYMQFSPDGKYLAASFFYPNILKIWDTFTGKQISTAGHSAFVTALAFSPDNKYCLSAAITSIKIWNTQTGQLMETIECARQSKYDSADITTLSMSADNMYLVAGSNHGETGTAQLFKNQALEIEEADTSQVKSK